jgi:hypothetical protein
MHELHKAVGDVLRSIDYSGMQVLLDSACGGVGRQYGPFRLGPPSGKSGLRGQSGSNGVVEDLGRISLWLKMV